MYAESCIVKHPECAAAINSSGFVPMPSSKRVLNEYWVLSRTLLSVVILPLPSLSDPCQIAVACLFMCVELLICEFGLPEMKSPDTDLKGTKFSSPNRGRLQILRY